MTEVFASLSVDIKEGGKLTSSYPFKAVHNSLQCFAVVGGAVAILGSDASGEDAHHGTVVEEWFIITEDKVRLLRLTTWDLLDRKSRIQLQRELFNPRSCSFLSILEGPIVLNAEL